jgi:hypothetical protein
MGSAEPTGEVIKISRLLIAIQTEVWHSHSVLTAQRRHNETPHPIRSASHAGHAARLSTREEWLLDSRRIPSIRLVFPVTGLPGYGTHSSQKTLWSVAEYADTSGNSEKSGVRVPSRRVHLFPDQWFGSPVAIEASYFRDTESRDGKALPE